MAEIPTVTVHLHVAFWFQPACMILGWGVWLGLEPAVAIRIMHRLANRAITYRTESKGAPHG